MTLPVTPADLGNLKAAGHQYRDYCRIRIEFLLRRRQTFPDFPGVQTGYNSITGREFDSKDILSYSWINGRGACVFSRFSRYYPDLAKDLRAYASAVIEVMEKHWEMNDHTFPFLLDLDGMEKVVGQKKPRGYKSYSDLYAAAGFLEYGSTSSDNKRTSTARQILSETLPALRENHFFTEPEATPPDRVLENPWSVTLDVANEHVKQLQDPSWLDMGAELTAHLLEKYYRPETGAFVEYVTPDGKPFADRDGMETVDPGHAIEFCCFALEFSRLAEMHNRHGALRARVNEVAPRTIRWMVDNGWNAAHPGIYKTIDSRSHRPLNDTMPWWILPETLLALTLAYERTHDPSFLRSFKKAHDTYFTRYMNPVTDWGPFQNIDGKTGTPIDIVPACKFQDPEFHSGRNLLTVGDVLQRIQA